MTRRHLIQTLTALLSGLSSSRLPGAPFPPGAPSPPGRAEPTGRAEPPQGAPSPSSARPPEFPPADPPPWLRDWLAQPIHPIIESADPLAQRLLAHQFTNTPLAILYANSSDSPHQPRLVTPILLFEKESSPATYLLAYCHRRHAPRCFNLNHLHPVR